MAFPEYDREDGRMRVPVSGRVLLLTNSPTVEYMDDNQRECFGLNLFPAPEFIGPDGFLIKGRALLVPIECDGYLLLNTNSYYNLRTFHAFQRFEFSASACAVVTVFAGFPKASGYEWNGGGNFYRGASPVYVHQYNMQWTSNDPASAAPPAVYLTVEGPPNTYDGTNLRSQADALAAALIGKTLKEILAMPNWFSYYPSGG